LTIWWWPVVEAAARETPQARKDQAAAVAVLADSEQELL
jgi:hypothetical protein